jgi:hypothetical protein
MFETKNPDRRKQTRRQAGEHAPAQPPGCDVAEESLDCEPGGDVLVLQAASGDKNDVRALRQLHASAEAANDFV